MSTERPDASRLNAQSAPYLAAQSELLNRYYGYDGLHAEQQDAVNALLMGRNVSVIAPTGFGKSLCYILPALVLYHVPRSTEPQVERRAVTVVVSPLVALISDQVSNLRSRGVPCAMITSAETEKQNAQVLGALTADAPNEFALLYVTAERVTSASFLNLLVRLHRRHRLGAFAIDEAHCISQWVRYARARSDVASHVRPAWTC